MPKINSTTLIHKKCENPLCNNPIEIKIYSNPLHPNYGFPIVAYQKRITCSHECHTLWQKSISWEDRIGKDRASEIRKTQSHRAKIDNPSTRPGIAKKISNSMKEYLKDNPGARAQDNNPFYGQTHDKDLIEHWKNTKTGKRSYNAEQKEKQSLNTPKKENHPNWQGGIANGEYGLEFNWQLKERIKESYNYTCQLCNNAGTSLDVHHIDYDKKNNSDDNLVPLCKVCHGKTNHNREIWQELLSEKLTKI